MRWSFFFGACVLAGYFLLSNGAPPAAVALGVALAAGLNLLKGRKASPAAPQDLTPADSYPPKEARNCNDAKP